MHLSLPETAPHSESEAITELNHHNRQQSVHPIAEAPAASTAPRVPISPRYRYLDLSGSGSEVLIEHEGQIYRLRRTRNGKLILNK